MNNFNDGDKILCKKDLTYYGNHIIEGDYYIFHDNMFSGIFNDFYCCYISESNNIFSYYLTEHDLVGHFFMKNEIRKLKLEKLYEETEY